MKASHFVLNKQVLHTDDAKQSHMWQTGVEFRWCQAKFYTTITGMTLKTPSNFVFKKQGLHTHDANAAHSKRQCGTQGYHFDDAKHIWTYKTVVELWSCQRICTRKALWTWRRLANLYASGCAPITHGNLIIKKKEVTFWWCQANSYLINRNCTLRSLLGTLCDTQREHLMMQSKLILIKQW